MPWKKQFDPQLALRRAMEVFWTHGYEAASMADLLAAMGIQKGSFYDTFGSKHSLYLKAIDLYFAERFHLFREATAGMPAREALLKLFALVREECLGKTRNRSCLAVNSVLERAQSDPQALAKIQEGFEGHKQLLTDLLRTGKAEGSIAAGVDPAEAATVLVGLTMAMRVYGKAQAPSSTIDALHRHAQRVLGEAAEA